jgi:hypothetical protein
MAFKVLRQGDKEELKLLEVLCIELKLNKLIIDSSDVLLELAVEKLFHFIIGIA